MILSGRFKSKGTDFRMSNSIINNLTSTDQTKILFYSEYLSKLWLYGPTMFRRKIYMFMDVYVEQKKLVSFDLKQPDLCMRIKIVLWLKSYYNLRTRKCPKGLSVGKILAIDIQYISKQNKYY